jgi:hypothetical protein
MRLGHSHLGREEDGHRAWRRLGSFSTPPHHIGHAHHIPVGQSMNVQEILNALDKWAASALIPKVSVA